MDAHALRSRLVWIDLRPFDVTGLVDADNTRPERTVVLDLFDDVSFPVRFTAYELTADHRCVLFYGTVEGSGGSRAVAALSANVFSANLSVGNRRYQVRWAAPDLHRVEELEAGSQEAFRVAPPMNLAVAYTTAARMAAGGQRIMHNLVELIAAEANWEQAMVGSPNRVRVVYDQEVDLPESGSEDLDRLRFEQTRDQLLPDPHGADTVSLWLERSSRGLRIQMEAARAK